MDEAWRRALGRRISRRDLLRGAGRGSLGLGVAALLAACRGREAGVAPTGAESPTPPATELPPVAGELSVAQWPLYIDRAKGGRRPSLEAFQKETGIRVEYREIINDNYAFFAKLAALLEAGQPTGWDIIALSDWVVGLMVEQGWLLPLDWSLLPTVEANLLPAFRDPVYDPGNAHSVPWQGGVTGIAYYPDLVGGEITAFADLWDPRLEGRVGMLTEMVDTMTLTLLMLGVDPQTATLDDAEAAKEKLIEQRDAGIVRKYYGQDYVDDLVAKNTWASMAWSGDIFYYKYLGGAPDLEFVVPEEGGVIWATPLEIPVGAEHPRDAHLFMDFYYRPEIAAMVTDWVLYMTPVKGVREIMLQKAQELKGADRAYYETLANSPLLFPPDDPTAANLHQYKAFSGEEFTAWNELFEEVVRG
ncbi:MAG TPA: spermidine/putrescine ABC transporter substrate-binding protein [Actinomycetota bacterium]|nr:spermidine/putrescine ABC transporter substrate-binding protein [Actinomycetota bacterium]